MKRVSQKYRPTFFDILPSTAVLVPELPAFPGALRMDGVKKGLRIKVVNNSRRESFSWNREAVFTVTDKPFKDHNRDYRLEVVFDRHLKSNHPSLEPGEYKSCCYKDVSAADLGLVPYSDRHWNQDNYCVECTNQEPL